MLRRARIAGLLLQIAACAPLAAADYPSIDTSRPALLRDDQATRVRRRMRSLTDRMPIRFGLGVDVDASGKPGTARSTELVEREGATSEAREAAAMAAAFLLQGSCFVPGRRNGAIVPMPYFESFHRW